MGSSGSGSGGGGIVVKLAVAALVGLAGLASIGLVVLGSEDPPPDRSCLPGAANVSAGEQGSGALKAAADEAVGAGRQQGIDVAIFLADPGSAEDRLTAGATTAMPAASVIKLAVAIAAGKRIDAGAVSSAQVKPLLDPMISVSDNAATNRLVALLGGREVVNSQVRSLGVTAGEAHLGRDLGVEVSGRDPNTMSIVGAAKLLQIIYDSDRNVGAGPKISRGSAAMIVAAMRAQTVNTKFGAVIAPDQMAHKTGELGGTSHDVGWFFGSQRWLTVAILTSKPAATSQDAGNEIIKRFARKVFDARDQPVTSGTTLRGPPDPAPPAAGDATAKSMPLKAGDYQVSSRFGPRGSEMHQGVDFAAPIGTPIYAAATGVVAEAGPASGFGTWIVVDIDSGKQSNVYGHMRPADLKVRKGQRVSAGQQIAAVGNEGQSTGPHLHFELWTAGTRLGGGRPVDPLPWLRGAAQPSGVAPPAIRNVAAVTPGEGCGDVAVGGSKLRPGSVPAAFEPWIIKAANTCPEITAPVIAAQLENEGGFNVNAHNAESGADGPAQFLPDTWAAKAVDGDGDGTKNPRSIPDAVMTQAAYDCELAGIMRQALKQGKIKGDLLELTLSAYNCGPGATLSSGGPCGNAQTQAYIKNIPLRARTVFAVPDVGFALGGPTGQRIVAAAMRWLGTTYAWGGGTPRGPSKGISDGGVADAHGDFGKVGFDCSGLVLYAVYQATGGKIELAHYTVTQLNDPRGKPVPRNEIQPGDIVFPGGGSPQHVAIYIGGNKMVEAPQSGDVVKVSPLSNLGNGISARRFAA